MGIAGALLMAGLAFVVVKKLGNNNKNKHSYGAPQYGAPQYGAPGGYRQSGGMGGMAGMVGGLMGGKPGGGGGGGGMGGMMGSLMGKPGGGMGGMLGGGHGSRDIGATAMPTGPPPDMGAIMNKLISCINQQRIGGFFPHGVDHIAQRVLSTGAIQRVAAEWRLPQDVAIDLVQLALYDIVVLCDDSQSMLIGERIEDLRQTLAKMAYAATLFDDDGIEVRFVNSFVQGNRIRDGQAAVDLIEQVQFTGPKPLGTALDSKILQPIVLGPARSGQLRKPVLVIVITDGQPSGEQFGLVHQVIGGAAGQLNSTPLGPNAVAYQFAQVGDDLAATQFLGSLDNDPSIGPLIDCTSDYDIEAREMQQKSGQQLTPQMWLMKLALGGIDHSYDSQD